MTVIALKTNGNFSLTGSPGDPINLDYQFIDYLGDGVAVDVKLSLKTGETVPNPLNTLLRLTWRDTATDDEIFVIEGIVGLDEENTSSLMNRAAATQAFEYLEVTTSGASFTSAVQNSEAYNAPNTRGRNVISLILPVDEPPALDEADLFNAITLMRPRPSCMVLPQVDDLLLTNTVLRAVDKLNIPLDLELDPTLTIDQACDTTLALDIQDSRVSVLWSPNVARPRDAVSIYGPKKPRMASGAILGMTLLRNARKSAQGIPYIADPIAGEAYPITFKAMECRRDIKFTDEAVEKLAQAKINVIREIDYSSGARFVVSDVLTQYVSDSSALRLKNSAEIACFTTNTCIAILKRHMLKRMASYITDANREIGEFLEACSSEDVGLLQPAEDLGGRPYEYAITPDSQKPFERVRLYLARRPEGATRSAIFDDDVLVK